MPCRPESILCPIIELVLETLPRESVIHLTLYRSIYLESTSLVKTINHLIIGSLILNDLYFLSQLQPAGSLLQFPDVLLFEFPVLLLYHVDVFIFLTILLQDLIRPFESLHDFFAPLILHASLIL